MRRPSDTAVARGAKEEASRGEGQEQTPRGTGKQEGMHAVKGNLVPGAVSLPTRGQRVQQPRGAQGVEVGVEREIETVGAILVARPQQPLIRLP